MTDTVLMMKKVDGLVKYAARLFGANGHFCLNEEDMIGEGWLVFAKIVNSGNHTSDESFLKLFKTSLFNHFRTMLEKWRYIKKREGFEIYVDLADVAEEVGYDVIDDIYYNNYVSHIASILADDPLALSIFENLVNPCESVCLLVKHEIMRKNHVKSLGIKVRVNGAVENYKHIIKWLGIDRETFIDKLGIVKSVVLDVIRNQSSLIYVEQH